MTYQDALNRLPKDAYLSTSFGYQGCGGYSEIHRTPDGRRFMLSNGSYLDYAPFTWTIKPID